MPQSPYEALMAEVRQIDLLGGTASLLSWDQETMMPPAGVAYRSGQSALLSRLRHERFTSPRIGELLSTCEADDALTADALSPPAVNLRELRRDYDRALKLPAELVAEFSRATSIARHVWAEARKADDYAAFKPHLKTLIDLLNRKAECYGWPEDGERWDALAEGFEPGLTARGVEAVFDPLRPRLVALIQRIGEGGRQPEDALNRVRVPIDAQMRFVRAVAERLGFDFSRGRLDVSAHPFCGGTHRDDVRMTTRFGQDNLGDALGSTMHETGHGIYNQSVPAEHVGEPFGRAVGLSIHESQSRLWENFVGRRRSFWRWCAPLLGEHFGDAFTGVGPDEAWVSMNRVEPGLIRVEADETTYNLHIMIRFELERRLLGGDLSVDDLPAAWNAAYARDLGIEVPNDADGCMQDVHWSIGAMGYFPTYTMGNLYAAQFFEAAQSALGDVDAMFARGEFGPLRQWLTERIYSQGRRYLSEDLCRQVTGGGLSSEPLLNHLEARLGEDYGL